MLLAGFSTDNGAYVGFCDSHGEDIESGISGDIYWVAVDDKPDALVMLDIEETGQIVPRPEMPVTREGNILTVPAGASFDVTGPATITGVVDESGILDFEFDEPGDYEISLTLFPYRPYKVMIHED